MTTHDDDKLLKQKQQRSKEAIDLAMKARWQEAVEANLQIIGDFPDDVDSHNRLGRAYMELGKYSSARQAYQHTQQLDPFNAIAARNLRRLSDLDDADTISEVETDTVDPHHFIEEIGKAGVVVLYDVAPKEQRARMVAGDKVTLKVEGSALAAYNSRNVYMGKVDQKYAQRLSRLMLGGNQYSASVIKSTVDSMTIIIREIYQHPSQAGKLSFPPKGMEEFRTYAGDRMLKVDDEDEDDSGYTIVGGDDVEVLTDGSDNMDDDSDSDDE